MVLGFNYSLPKLQDMKHISKIFLITLVSLISTFSFAQKEVIKSGDKELITEKENNNYVSFTLRNNSAKSIPLIIPTVMNPNLSPFSNSGVSLKMGQEILFKNKGRKYVLLTVSDEIQQGDVLDVDKLLKAKKKELALKM